MGSVRKRAGRRGWPNNAIRESRDVFYWALASEAPEVLRDLVESCLHLLPGSIELSATPAGQLHKRPEIERCLLTWSKRHRLNASWLLEDAAEYLIDSSDPGSTPVTLTSSLSGSEESKLATQLISVNVEMVWRIEIMSAKQFRTAALSALEGNLDAAMNRAILLSEEHGASELKQRRSSNAMKWLVRYQVHHLDFPEIAEEYGKTESDVGRAVREAAAEIRLRRRLAQTGGRKR